MTITDTPSGELIDMLRSFIDSDPRLHIWRRYPYITEADNDYTDNWACEQVSAEFAVFALKAGWEADVVRGTDPEEPFAFDHVWVRLTRDGVVTDVDWTARQFHNLFAVEGHDPNVLTLPWPLAWDPAAIAPEHHLIVGTYAAVAKEAR
jgi:hypothetical protein